MPPPLLFELDDVDLNSVQITREQIYARLPHRYEFMLLDGACYIDPEGRRVVAFHDCGDDPWWAKGHVPGRPLMPGVLMLEIAAQTAAFASQWTQPDSTFMAFGGIDQCKFREAAFPGDRLYVLAEAMEKRPRKFVSRTQGIKEGRVVFEATITGLVMR
ncbi:MAG: beta-hydroxyacyl-ACP dehydratase [Phycisphaerae bacterium]|nr:beta-hydroxyacyl-ACP dehydratase [Phycisphaerae bacterium]